MIQITDPHNCCGCTACASICAHQAITMHPDSMGFRYPQVDADKCTDCGLCDHVCAFHDQYDVSQNLPVPQAYAVRHKQFDHVLTSQSGAAFIAISDWILQQGGVVYGVGYTGHLHVAHMRATTPEQRDQLKRSKYVQSDLNNIFPMIRGDLQSGLKVLFTGTPCQCAGLNAYLPARLKENLFVMDMVCHGVPSPKLWEDFVSHLEKKYGDSILSYNFRDKSFGWASHHETFTLAQHPDECIHDEQTFYKYITIRYSCNTCHFANTHRPSDITIGDFWGWQNVVPDMFPDNKGLSLLMVNTPKGQELWQQISVSVHARQVPLDMCLQQNLKQPTIQHPLRDKFEHDYARYGIDYVLDHNYYDKNLRVRTIEWGKNKWTRLIQKIKLLTTNI